MLLAVLAGLFSAGQNFAFSLTQPMQTLALDMGAGKLGASIIMWPGFLFFCFIPYVIYMLSRHKKNNSWGSYRHAHSKIYLLYAIVMGAFWYGSLLFYSKASQLIGMLGPVIGWPLFMVMIILSSNFWGWRHKEWANAGKKALSILWCGLGLLVMSVIILAYASHLPH